MSRHSWGISVLSVVVACGYYASCILPVAYFDEGGTVCTAIRMGTPTGFAALFMGWLPPWTIPWSANVLLAVGSGQLYRRNFSAAARCGGTAIVLGLTTWGYVAIGFIPHLLPGYYVWMATLLTFSIGAAGLASLQQVQSTVRPENLGMRAAGRSLLAVPPLRKVAFGIFGAVLLAGIFLSLAPPRYAPGDRLMLLPVVAFMAYGGLGGLEIRTGTRFPQVEDWWTSLAWWRQGIYGLMIVLAAILLFILIAAVLLW